MQYSMGVDIGGTKIAIAIVSEYGNIIEKNIIQTDHSKTPEQMISIICGEIKKVVSESGVQLEEIKGVGVGAPGPLDSENGRIICPPNLKSWIDIPIVQLMKQELALPVLLENDANVAALAEKWIGAGLGSNNFAYMTVSTGVGAGIIVDGNLLRGIKGNAGDIGHTVVDPSFGQCSCGQYGCLESIASGTAIAEHGTKIIGRELSTKEVFELYSEGEEKIVDLIERIFRVLGVACVSMINTFDLEKIVIGGGVSEVGEVLFNAVQSYVGKYALNPVGRQTKVVPAKLGQSAGVIGAADLWFFR